MKLQCTLCAAAIDVELTPETRKVQCPQCAAKFKIQRKSKQISNPSPASPPVDEAGEVFEPLDDSGAETVDENEEEFDYGDEFLDAGDDVYDPDDGDLLDDDGIFGLQDDEITAGDDDIGLDAGEEEFDYGDDDVAELPPIPAPRPPQSRKKKTQKKKPRPKKKDQRNLKPLLIVGGGAAACLTLLLLGGGIWLLVTGRSDSAGSAGGAPAESVAELDEIPGVPEGVAWETGEVFVLDAPVGVPGANRKKPPEPFYKPLPEAAAVRIGENGEPAGSWRPFTAIQADPPPEMPPATDFPFAGNDRHFVLLSVAPSANRQLKRSGGAFEDIWWQMFERESGEPVGGPRLFTTRFLATGNKPGEFIRLKMAVAALSPDSKTFAAAEITDNGHVFFKYSNRVRIWTHEGKQFQFTPREESEVVAWLDWTPQGELLTVSGGVLASWPVEQGKPADEPSWTITMGPTPVVAWAPGRQWLAVHTEGAILLIDPVTGAPRARLPYEADRSLKDIAISPDGLRLAAFFLPPKQSRQDSTAYADLVLWNLQAGVARKGLWQYSTRDLQDAIPHWHQRPHDILYWPAVDRLIVLNCNETGPGCTVQKCTLHDVSEKAMQAPGIPQKALLEGILSNNIACDFEGRLWTHQGASSGGDRYFPVTFLDPDIPAHQPMFEPWPDKPADAPPNLQIEISAGSPRANRARAEAIAVEMQKEEIEIGPGEFTLRVRVGVADSGQKFDIDPAWINKTTIPKLLISYKLFDKDGKEIWSKLVEESWLYEKSRYRMTREEMRRKGLKEKKLGQPLEYNVYFDFPAGNPFALMANELKEDRGDPNWLHDLPDLLKGGTDFGVPEPLQGALKSLERLAIKHKGQIELPQNEVAEIHKVISAERENPDLAPAQHRGLEQLLESGTDSMRVDSKLHLLKSEAQILARSGPPKLAVARPRAADLKAAVLRPAVPDVARAGLLASLELPTGVEAPSCMSFSPDGGTLHVIAAGRLLTYEPGADRWSSIRPLVKELPGAPFAAVAADFSRVVLRNESRNESTITVVNTKSFAERVIPLEKRERPQFVRLSPDGRYLACATDQKTVHVWNLSTGRSVLNVKPENESGYPQVGFSRDGSLFAILATPIRLYDARRLQPLGEIPHTPGYVYDIFLAGNGSTLARHGNRDITAWKLTRTRSAVTADGEPIVHDSGSPHSSVKQDMAISDDGAAVALYLADDYTVSVAVRELETGYVVRDVEVEEKDLTRNVNVLRNADLLALSSEGHQLAVFDGQRIHLFDIATPLEQLLADPAEPVNVALPEELLNE